MLLLNRTPPIALLSLLSFSTYSYGEQSYQVELNGRYESGDSDSSSSDYRQLAATIYLAPVNTEDKPLHEAAFLNKSSAIRISYFSSEIKDDFNIFSTLKRNGPTFSVNYVTEENSIILGAAYSQSDIDLNNPASGDSDTFGANLGIYLNDTSTLRFSYSNRSTDFDFGFASTSIDTDFYTLSYKTLVSLADLQYFNFETSIKSIQRDAGLSQGDNFELRILGSYFFNFNTNLTTAIKTNSGDNASNEGVTFSVSVSHFLTSNIALAADFTTFIADDDFAENTDTFSINATARF